MAGVKFDAHYHLTTVDPPELVKFIREKYPKVKRERPIKTMWQLIRWQMFPPTRRTRYCCYYLKEGGGNPSSSDEGRRILTGIRWQESRKRKDRQMTEHCLKGHDRFFVHPIIDWTSEDVWRFIEGRSIAYCSLYDQGFKRLGCVLCPYGSKKEMEMQRWPKIAAAYKRAIFRAWDLRIAAGRKSKFHDAEELWQWWIGRDTSQIFAESKNQEVKNFRGVPPTDVPSIYPP
jgi:phosphoadenosine phosphosulfate reductase